MSLLGFSILFEEVVEELSHLDGENLDQRLLEGLLLDIIRVRFSLSAEESYDFY